MANLRLDENPPPIIQWGVFNLLGSISYRSDLGSEERDGAMNPFILLITSLRHNFFISIWRVNNLISIAWKQKLDGEREKVDRMRLP